MKKKLKRLFYKDNGSVSIYMIIIILPIFLLNALLIDTLRILSAEREIENAIDTALRSTMASFNTDLANVGLFAYGGDNDVSNTFNGYVNDQFYNNGLSGYQNLISPRIDSATATFVEGRELVELDVFRHQVLESMKYQAPVQMGESIFTLLSGGKGISQEQIDNAEKLVENYEEIIGLMKKRNAEIEEARKQLEQIIQVIQVDIPERVIGTVPNGEEKPIPKDLKTFNQVLFYYDRYNELKDKEKLSDDEQKEIDNFENGLNEETYISVVNVETFVKGINDHLFGENGTVTKPKEGSAKFYNDKINDLMEPNMELLDDLKKFTLTDAFFKDIKTNIETIYEEIRIDKPINGELNIEDYSIGQLFGAFYLSISGNSKPIAESIIEYIQNKLILLQENQIVPIEDYINRFIKLRKDLNNVDTKNEEEKADKNFGDLWAILNVYSDVKNQIEVDSEIYKELNKYVLEYNGTSGGSETVDEPSRLQFIKDAFNRFKEFVTFIQGFPESVRNELYINEYILANYGTQAPYELIGTKAYQSFSYATKQAQYITYGYAQPGVNYFMFIKDIALIMFVANLLSQVLQGGFAGPLGFFKALAASLATTLNDLQEITRGPHYELTWSPFSAFGKRGVKVTMPMFLRIIMMMKSTTKSYNNEKLRRLQAVVTKETNQKLNDASTYLKGNIEGKIKLWFIPALTEMLPNDFGRVQGSYYYIDKDKVYSY
ncbi:hypothetical protein [Virgibacillus oceani]|uniref:Uncharacterized protein n=1 Tax=Virgibacillus oceani TaxID=1479511 RepID=A0A917LW81_9BACI|nr:hypothetical protein [Virgibacillus oceani]GGG62951.1 hypothetical protein GCM10011398_02920 [Virgibacillus oceani]